MSSPVQPSPHSAFVGDASRPVGSRKETPGGQATRDFIIEVATDLFGQHGYQGVTVRQLTLAAKVNLSAITYHFGGKEELYRMTVEALMERIGGLIGAPVQALGQAVGQAGADKAALRLAAETFIRDWAQLVLANGDVQRRLPVLAMELLSPTPAFPIIYEHFYKRLYEALGGLIGAAQGLAPGSLALSIRVHGVASLMLGFVASERVLWRSLGWEGYSSERVAHLAPHLAAVFISAVGFS